MVTKINFCTSVLGRHNEMQFPIVSPGSKQEFRHISSLSNPSMTPTNSVNANTVARNHDIPSYYLNALVSPTTFHSSNNVSSAMTNLLPPPALQYNTSSDTVMRSVPILSSAEEVVILTFALSIHYF